MHLRHVYICLLFISKLQNAQDKTDQLSGTGMDWVLLGFAVITPLSLSVGIAFRRRERALVEIAKFRSFAYQLFLSHCTWDWGLPPDGGKAGCTHIDWVAHADDVLRELIAVGDELCRFLTLPTASRSRYDVSVLFFACAERLKVSSRKTISCSNTIIVHFHL